MDNIPSSGMGAGSRAHFFGYGASAAGATQLFALISGQLLHDAHDGALHLRGHRLQFRVRKHAEQGGGQDGGHPGFAVLLIDRDAAGQDGGNGRVVVQDLFGLLGIADFEDQALPVKDQALFPEFLADIDATQNFELVFGADFREGPRNFGDALGALHHFDGHGGSSTGFLGGG